MVGSFAFPESEILGEIYAQALTAKGVEVETKFNIGPRQQTIPALRDGSINLIPEYNGNLLAFYNPEYTERTTADVDKALDGRRGHGQAPRPEVGRRRGQGRLRGEEEDRDRQRAHLHRRPVQDRPLQARLEPAVR